MMVFVKVMKEETVSKHDEILSVIVDPTDTVKALWKEIAAEEMLKLYDLNNAKLLHNGVELQDNKTMMESGMKEGAYISLHV